MARSHLTDDLLRLMLLLPFLALIAVAFLGNRFAHSWYGDVLAALLAVHLVGSFVALERRNYTYALLTRARFAHRAHGQVLRAMARSLGTGGRGHHRPPAAGRVVG